MAKVRNATEHPLWSDDENVVAFRMMLFEGARARAKDERGVTLADLADAIGVSANTLGKWLRVPPPRLNGAATNRMDAEQVRKACAALDVSMEYLLRGDVAQPMMPSIASPTDATSDRYTPDRIHFAYMALDEDNQRRATEYIADLLRVQRAERMVSAHHSEARGVVMLADAAIGIMHGSLDGHASDDLACAVDNYESAARHFLDRWQPGPESRSGLPPLGWCWERASKYHRRASDRGRKPTGAGRADCADDVN